MYPQPSQNGQWSPNPPAPSSSAPSQQVAPQWAPPPPPAPQAGAQPSPAPHPSNAQYPRPPAQLPSHPQNPPPPQQAPQHMASLPPQDPYRGLPPPPPGTMYAHSPYHPQPMQYAPPQPAPRQRTAIACRYCRRRKIRCSGFEHSEDGRCTNCQRFSQECIFTPVSQQSQAFVPAHTVMGRQGQMPPQLYGAYGQPLSHGHFAYPPQYHPNGYPPQYMMAPQYPPHPMAAGQPGPQGPSVQPPAQNHDTPPVPEKAGMKRKAEGGHAPTDAPPNPALASQLPSEENNRAEDAGTDVGDDVSKDTTQGQASNDLADDDGLAALRQELGTVVGEAPLIPHDDAGANGVSHNITDDGDVSGETKDTEDTPIRPDHVQGSDESAKEDENAVHNSDETRDEDTPETA